MANQSLLQRNIFNLMGNNVHLHKLIIQIKVLVYPIIIQNYILILGSAIVLNQFLANKNKSTS